MRVLITGGTGQIGSRLAFALYNLKHDVTVLDKKINKPSYISDLIKTKKIKTISLDLNTYTSKRKLRKLGRFDAVFHLAADITDTDQMKYAKGSMRSHIDATVNLLRYIQKPNYICYASSVMVYGRLLGPYHADENHPCNPYNFYGIGKLAAEKIISLHCEKNKLPLSILRIGSVYGKMDCDVNHRRAIPAFIGAVKEEKDIFVYGDGSNLRDYIYLDDVIDAMVQCLEKHPKGIFNIVSGKSISILDLAKTIVKISGSPSRILAFKDKPMEHSASFSNALAKTTFGFNPATTIEEGLKEVLQ